MRLRILLAAGFGALVLGLIGTRSVQALTLVPPSLEYSAVKGQTFESKVKLFNNDSRQLTLTPSTANFSAKDETGEPDFAFDAPATDLASWIQVSTQPFTIAPGESREIPFKIVVPNDAEPGGHYAGIFFGSGGQASQGGQIGLQSKLGSLIIMRVDGVVREAASIASFGVKHGKTLSRLPATFNVRVQNSGNVHIRPQGTILIKNLFGGQTETLSVNESNGAVLPNSIRSFDATWSKTSDAATSSGWFNELKAQWRNFSFGPYTATVTLTYGQNNQSLVASTKVTIIPWRLMLVELVILALVVIAIVFGVRGYNRAIIRRAQNTPPQMRG